MRGTEVDLTITNKETKEQFIEGRVEGGTDDTVLPRTSVLSGRQKE